MARFADEDHRCRGVRKPFGVELTEQDPDLALRGFIIARTGVLPTDPSFRELSQSRELLEFTAHWLQKRDTDLLDSIAKMIGTVWTRDQVARMTEEGASAAAPKELFIPLAAAINPEIIDWLKKTLRVSAAGEFIGGGEYHPAAGEEVVELGDLPREEFMKFATQATATIRKTSEENARQQETVRIKQGPAEDARINRIKDQIARSKRW